MNVQEKIFETPSGTIHYWISRAENNGKWLVFLPGLTADHRLFDKQMEYFAGRCNCIVWDAPGHGKSRPFGLTFSMDDMARWLHEILLEEQAYAPVLIGQSLGGYVAQVYMELYPGETAGFISIDSCSLKRKYYTGWELGLLKHTKWMYMSFPWRLLRYCALFAHGSCIFAEAA